MQKLRNIILLPFFLFLPFITEAFINVESLRLDDKKGFNGAIDFSLLGKAGNNDRGNFKGKTFNKYLNTKNEFLAIGAYSYGISSGERDLNQGYLHLRYTRIGAKQLSCEVYNQFQFAEFKRLDLRTVLGLGLRVKMIKSEKTSFYLGVGSFYETENLKDLENVETGRANIYASLLHEPNERAKVTFTNYFQPSVSKFEDMRYQSNLGLQQKITSKISTGVLLKYSFDNAPPEGVKKSDFSYNISLNYKY